MATNRNQYAILDDSTLSTAKWIVFSVNVINIQLNLRIECDILYTSNFTKINIQIIKRYCCLWL